MITLLVGENSFEIDQALSMIIKDFDGEVERINGSDLQTSQIPDILMGASLFADSRLVVIKELCENKLVWSVISDWLPRVSDDIHLVLVESKPDKRTTTFKTLKKIADVREFLPWSDRDTSRAEKWVADQSENTGVKIDKKCVQFLVQWVGVDQWQLFYSLEKLSLIDVITVDSIKNLIEPNPIENVFNLFETALRGDTKTISLILHTLEQTQDVYQLAALLFSQSFQLAVIISSSKTDNIVHDFGLHPYVVTKLTTIANRLGKAGVSKIVAIFIELDDDMKLSKAEPWLLIERALTKVSNIK
ncbi:MAG: DNA polymerase III subunit delta [Candidatus Saccharibacteria bacterium]